jgi:hypothetical protein
VGADPCAVRVPRAMLSHMKIQYEPQLIYMFAERLYARAGRLAWIYAVLGTLFGAAIGAVLGALGIANSPPTGGSSGGGLVLLLGGVLGGLVGFEIGWERGFALRLEAQRTLCQLKAEEAVRFLADAQAMTRLEK